MEGQTDLFKKEDDVMLKSAIVLSSDNCYEGYDKVEECWVLGDYSSLEELENVNSDTIIYSESGWSDEKEYFTSFLEKCKEAYKKKFNKPVAQMVLAGKLGLWNGSPIGGKLIDLNNSPLEAMGNCDTVELEVDSNGEVTVLGHHHDGTHRMKIYLFSHNLYRGMVKEFGEGSELFEHIHENMDEHMLNANDAEDFFQVPTITENEVIEAVGVYW